MQLQFNNSPLGGRRRDQALEGRDKTFLFSCIFGDVVVFGVWGRPPSPPSRWEKRSECYKGEVACFPRFASRLDTTARAMGCCWGCYWLDATDRMDFVTGSTLHSRLCLLVRLTCEVEAPTPLRTTTTTTWGTRQAAVILPRYCQAWWTEIMASHPACRLHAGLAKLPELSLMITTREHWPRTVTIMTHLTRTNEAMIGHIMWPLATASRVHCMPSLCILLQQLLTQMKLITYHERCY